MSTKFTALMLVTAVLLFSFIMLVERPARLAGEIPADQSVLPGLEPTNVNAVEIQIEGGARIIRAEKTNGIWQLTQPAPYPAAGRLVAALLQELAAWQWDSIIENPASWEEYGLVKDQFTISVEQGEETRTLKIGNVSPVGDKVYLSLLGSHQVFVARPDALKLIPSSDLQWRDLTLMNLNTNPFETLRVHSPSGDMKLQLDPATVLWKMSEPIEARADSAKINELLTRLQCTPVTVFPNTNADTAQLALTFLRDGTNKVVELRVGASLPKHPEWSYATRLFPPGLIAISNAVLLPWEADYTNFLDRHLISVSPETIASIEVEGGGIERFTAQRTEAGPWEVSCTNGESFPADEILMRNWLSALTNIQVVSGRSPQAELAPYGLDQPAQALWHAKVFFAGAETHTNPPAADLLFGLGTNRPEQIYEMRAGEKTVNTIDAASFGRLPRYYWQLRDRTIWHFATNQVVAIDIHQQGVDVRYTRDAKGVWARPPGYAVEIFPPAIEMALGEMGQLKAQYWSGYGDEHLDWYGFDETDYRVSFEINRNGIMETNTIQFGKPAAYVPNPYASVMRAGRRLIFEFPVDLYANLVQQYLSVPRMFWRTR